MADTRVVYAVKIISVNGNNKWYINGTLVVHMGFMNFMVAAGGSDGKYGIGNGGKTDKPNTHYRYKSLNFT